MEIYSECFWKLFFLMLALRAKFYNIEKSMWQPNNYYFTELIHISKEHRADYKIVIELLEPYFAILH